MTTLSKTETSQAILDKLSMFIQDSDSKVSAAMALGTSPRSLVRWAERVHPVPDRVVEILNAEYPDEDTSEKTDNWIELTDDSDDMDEDSLSECSGIKSILDAIHSIEHADPDAEVTPNDDEERVILLTANVVGYPYPVFLTIKSIDYREGNQFSLVRGTRGTLMLLNMANVTSLKTELIPVSDNRIVTYHQFEEKLSSMTALIVGRNTYKDVPVDLDTIILLRSGKMIAECEFGGVVEDDIEDINFIILDEEAAKLF